MAIDYGSYRRRARSLGRRQGFMEAQTKQREKMQERIQQIAADKGLAERTQAKAAFKITSAAAMAEDSEISQGREAGHYVQRDDGKLEYSDKYYQDMAYQQAKNIPGVTYKTQEEFQASAGSEAAIAQQRSGRGKFRNRKYKPMAESQANLQRYLADSNANELSESNRQALTGLDQFVGSLVNTVTGGAVNLNGKPEAPRERVRLDSGMVPESEKDFSTHESVDVPVRDASGGISDGKLEDFQTVEKLDGEGNVIPGKTYRMATNEETMKTYILKGTEGWVEIDGDYQVVDKQKTGEGKSSEKPFDSPLQELSFVKRSSSEGRSVNSLKALFETVSIKARNPKDFADRMLESLGNTLAAVAGFDGTEGEIVLQSLNSTSPEEKAAIEKAMGWGVQDAIHAGVSKQRELFATLHLARALAGTGKLSVNSMMMAKAVTEGGSGTKSLGTLEASRISMEKTLQRSIISQAGHHNIELMNLAPSATKSRVERVVGYPVFSSEEYRETLATLGHAADASVIKRLDELFKADRIFYKNKHGQTMAPAIVRYTTDQGTESFTIKVRPLHYE